MTRDMCPKCGTDLTGSAIPKEYIDAELYGKGVTHYSRKIAQYDTVLDRTVAWECPDCAHTWPRGKVVSLKGTGYPV